MVTTWFRRVTWIACGACFVALAPASANEEVGRRPSYVTPATVQGWLAQGRAVEEPWIALAQARLKRLQAP